MQDKEIYNNMKNYTSYQLFNYPDLTVSKYIKKGIESILYTRKLYAIDHFFWPNALLAISIEHINSVKQNEENIISLKKYYDNWLRKGSRISTLDHCLNGYTLLYLYENTKEEKYKNLATKIFRYIKDYPKLSDGSMEYRKNNGKIVLIDSLGMIVPFLCRYGKIFSNNEAHILGQKLLMNFIKNSMDVETGLPYHGYRSESLEKIGIVGWGRGMGWILIGLIDSLENLPENEENYLFLINEYKRLIDKCLEYQQLEGGFSWQLPAIEGHEDTSATSMIGYALRRGMDIKVLDNTYQKYIDKIIRNIISNQKNGIVNNCSAECLGVSMYPQIYKSFPWAQASSMSLLALNYKNKNKNNSVNYDL